MKNIAKILILILLSFGVVGNIDYAFSNDQITDENINTGNSKGPNGKSNDEYLNDFDSGDSEFFNVSNGGEKEIKSVLIRIARDLKNFFFVIATIYFFIIAFKLLYSKTEEGIDKFKKGIIWVTLGLMFMQIAYMFVEVMYSDESVGSGLAYRITDKIVYPLIDLVETVAAFLFLAVAIVAFYRIITANGDEEKAKNGKMSVGFGLVGYLIIKIAKALVFSVYGSIDCGKKDLGGIITTTNNNCVRTTDIGETARIIVDIINYINSFVGIIVIIMIIYAGAQVLFGLGDEEKLKKAKMSIIYIAIGIAILFANYLILTFFILPENNIGNI